MPTYYGASVDTRMALGDGDASPHHAERRDHAPTGPNVYEALNLSARLRVSHLPMSSSPGAIWVSTQYAGMAPLLRWRLNLPRSLARAPPRESESVLQPTSNRGGASVSNGPRRVNVCV